MQPQNTGLCGKERVADASKRKRIVHQNHAALGACDACRLRRVKCIRINPEDPTCEACLQKQLNCTQLRNGGVRYKSRTGKAILAAQRAYGNADCSARKALSSSELKDSTPSSSDSPCAFVLSDHSAEGRLSCSEESEMLLAGLMDFYYSTASLAIPLVQWTVLRARFEHAGRRLSQLDPITEVLVTACVALAAMYTDHPAVIGHDAPRLQDLYSSSDSFDLSKYAYRRTSFCNSMVERAVRLSDGRGILRDVSWETLSALSLMAQLMKHAVGNRPWTKAPSTARGDRASTYLSAAISHLRHLEEENVPRSELSPGTAWTVAIEDAYRCAVRGYRLVMSEDDLTDMVGGNVDNEPSLTLEPLFDAVFSTDINVCRVCIGSWWWGVLKLARKFGTKISVPSKRGNPPAISVFDELLVQTRHAFRQSLEASKLVSALSSVVPPDVLLSQRSTFGADVIQHISAMPLAYGNVLLIMYWLWQARESQCAKIAEILPGFGGDEFLDAATFQANLMEAVVEALITVTDMLEGKGRKAAVVELTAHLSLFGLIQYNMDAWACIALQLPCAEEGGPSSYPRHKQLAVARIAIDAVRCQSWTWKDRQPLADAFDQTYAAIQSSHHLASIGRPGLPAATGLPLLGAMIPGKTPVLPASNSDSSAALVSLGPSDLLNEAPGCGPGLGASTLATCIPTAGIARGDSTQYPSTFISAPPFPESDLFAATWPSAVGQPGNSHMGQDFGLGLTPLDCDALIRDLLTSWRPADTSERPSI